MESLLKALGVALLCFFPLLFALAMLAWQVAARRARRRYPLHGGIRRPAGESTRLRIEELGDSMLHALLWMIMLPSVLVMAATVAGAPLWPRVLISLGSALAGSVLLWRLYARLSSYSLGYDGERLVGTELQALERQGMRVFHDLPFEDGNIDHLVLGAFGVAVIETKTRRTEGLPGTLSPSAIRYDGRQLHFPWGADAFGLEQVRRNRAQVAAWLARELRREIPVHGILALPGWSVATEGGPHEVDALGHEALADRIAALPAAGLEAKDHSRIIAMMERLSLLPLGPTKAD